MGFNLIFIFTFSLLAYLYLAWGFKNLPREDMQVAAAVPVRKTESGHWECINLTYYGVLIANSTVLSIAVFFILAGGAGIPVSQSLIIVTALIAVSMPSSKIIARIVEKKSSTFTAGGGYFAGFLIIPAIIWLANALTGGSAPFITVLAAMSISYCIGEGAGRLACISFGCCYGKPLNSCTPRIQKLFQHFNFVFRGKTKKISYAHGWDGIKIIPIQGITAIVNIFIAISGMLLYIGANFKAALLITVTLSQGWRVLSEFIRSDYRGGKKFTDYQKMCIFSIFAAIVITALPIKTVETPIDLYIGLKSIGELPTVMFLQILWIWTTLYLGKSKVTASHMSIFVREDKI